MKISIEEVINIQLNKEEAEVFNKLLSHHLYVDNVKLTEEQELLVGGITDNLDSFLHP